MGRKQKTFIFLKNLNQNKVGEILNTLNDITQPNKDDINANMFEIEDIYLKQPVTAHLLSRKTSSFITNKHKQYAMVQQNHC